MKDKTLTIGTGVRSMVIDGIISKHIPDALFDDIYNLDTEPVCRTKDNIKECHITCEPGKNNIHGENLVLLPGEDTYLAKRLESKGIQYKWSDNPPVVVRLNKECPYYEEGACSIYEDRPIVCRSYPLRCHKIGAKSMSVLSAIGCPYKCSSADDIENNTHHKTWIGAWKAVLTYISDEWWDTFKRACPAGFRHLGDIIDKEEIGVPYHMLVKYANADCSDCRGDGVHDNGICGCISKEDISTIVNGIKHSDKKFTT